MKLLTGILAALVVITLSACKEDSATTGGITQPAVAAPTGTIDGEFSLDPSATGLLDNVQVALYRSEGDLRVRQPLTVVRTGGQGRFVITGVSCGRYYMDAWKDNDGNGAISTGDYYLVFTDCCGCVCSCTVQEGTAVSFCGCLGIVH